MDEGEIILRQLYVEGTGVPLEKRTLFVLAIGTMSPWPHMKTTRILNKIGGETRKHLTSSLRSSRPGRNRRRTGVHRRPF
jgi:hypothetical protein